MQYWNLQHGDEKDNQQRQEANVEKKKNISHTLEWKLVGISSWSRWKVTTSVIAVHTCSPRPPGWVARVKKRMSSLNISICGNLFHNVVRHSQNNDLSLSVAKLSHQSFPIAAMLWLPACVSGGYHYTAHVSLLAHCCPCCCCCCCLLSPDPVTSSDWLYSASSGHAGLIFEDVHNQNYKTCC